MMHEKTYGSSSIKLGPRLQLISHMVPSCRLLCDVGTDHGLIPAVLVLDSRCQKAIATDIKEGPLKRADKTVARYGLADKVETRLGEGLLPVAGERPDVIIIAGMGAMNIIDILENGDNPASKAERILLQPMHAQEKLRPWLQQKGYEILDEQLAEEGVKHYQVLAVRHPLATIKVFSELPQCNGTQQMFTESMGGNGMQQAVMESLNSRCTIKPLPGLPTDKNHILYQTLGWRILHRPDPLALAWLNDWITRIQRQVEGQIKAKHILGKQAADGEEKRLLLEDMLNCKEVLEKVFSTENQSAVG